MGSFSKPRFLGFIGNILEHYDQALYGMLAPFIAPLFFDSSDRLTGLILTYAIIPLGFITKPLGSIFFGFLGDRIGRKYALYHSLIGIGVVTVAFSFLPTYSTAGVIAPIALAVLKMLQSFFAAGQSVGGSIFILEQTPHGKRSWMSSLYNSSTMLGILLASGLVTLLSVYNIVEQGWRILFLLGGATVFLGFLLRNTHEDIEERSRVEKPKLLQILLEQKRPLLRIIVAAGFSYTTYSFAFTLMNGYVPLITALSKTDMMQLNTALLVADMLLLPLFGAVGQKIGKEKLMLLGAFWAAISSIPLFFILGVGSLGIVVFVRLMIMTLGVAFAAPYHAWALEQVPPEHRCIILSLGSALGSQLIGAPTSVISLWLYKQTGWVAAPGLYLLIIAGAASAVLYRSLYQLRVKSSFLD